MDQKSRPRFSDEFRHETVHQLKTSGLMIKQIGEADLLAGSHKDMVETVFKTTKSELIWRTGFASCRQAVSAIGQYIDGCHDIRWRISSLGYKSPLRFEAETEKP